MRAASPGVRPALARSGGVGTEEGTAAVEELEVIDYRPSGVLYRIAVAASRRARARSRQFEATRDLERRYREIDACVETIILTQAALEAAINEALREHDVSLTGPWVTRWKCGPAKIAGKLGRPSDFALPQELLGELQLLSAWRQFFVHGDNSARERFADKIGHEPRDVPDVCDADLAKHWIEQADKLFEWFGASTGIVHSPSRYLWVPHDDL